MKKRVLLLLISFISVRSFSETEQEPKKRTNRFEAAEQIQTPQKEKKNFFSEGVSFTIVQYLDSLKDILKLASIDKTSYVGVKKFLKSKKLFRNHPENRSLILATMAKLYNVKLAEHDEPVVFAQTFQAFCENLNIKDHKNLKTADYLTLLDFLITNLKAQKHTRSYPNTYRYLVKTSYDLLGKLAKILPTDTEAFQEILDAIQAESNNSEEKTESNEDSDDNTSEYVKYVNRVRNSIQNNKQAILRSHYLSLVLNAKSKRLVLNAKSKLKNKTQSPHDKFINNKVLYYYNAIQKNDALSHSLSRIIKNKELNKTLKSLSPFLELNVQLKEHWKNILNKNISYDQLFLPTPYHLPLTVTTLKNFHLLDETILLCESKTSTINDTIEFSITTENYAPIKYLASRMNIKQLINMVIKTLPRVAEHYEMSTLNLNVVTIIDEQGFHERYSEIISIYKKFIKKRIIPWYKKQQKSDDRKAAFKLIKKLYTMCEKSELLYEFTKLLENYVVTNNEFITEVIS